MKKRELILLAAARCAKKGAYGEITQSEIAREAGISTGLVTYYFDNMDTLRNDLMTWAVETKDLLIVAQGLAVQDPIAIAAPQSTKHNAIALLRKA